MQKDDIINFFGSCISDTHGCTLKKLILKSVIWIAVFVIMSLHISRRPTVIRVHKRPSFLVTSKFLLHEINVAGVRWCLLSHNAH